MRGLCRKECILPLFAVASTLLREALGGLVLAFGGLKPAADIKGQEVKGLKVVLVGEAKAPVDALLGLTEPSLEEGRHRLGHVQRRLAARLVGDGFQGLETPPDCRARP